MQMFLLKCAQTSTVPMQVLESRKLSFLYQPCPLRRLFLWMRKGVSPVHPAVVAGLCPVEDEEATAAFALAVVARTWCRETVLAGPA